MTHQEAYGEALSQVEELYFNWFSEASEMIKISTGLSSGMLNHSPLRDALVSAGRDRSVKLRMLLDPTVDEAEFRSEYRWLIAFKDREIRKSSAPVPHWLMIDHDKVRLEQPHDKGATQRSNLRITDCDPLFFKGIEGMFEKMWSQSQEIDL